MNKNKIAFLVVILILVVFTLPKALSKIEQIYVRYNCDFNSHFEVTDFSKVVVKLNLSQVDFDHEGIYPASIEAKDASNNTAKKEFQVLILEVE